ncbi:hypothetical protein Lalb_Chr13g0293961 [Lupinus albus]|uniref:Uncharacterized protein n=1 Tax=Lupinus albus TaxID=3870 RepID=A0A6A4PHQ8_LUPAL|nr:hypothetical protein Lalb_Chr13g0293961 [Lupinus albus]
MVDKPLQQQLEDASTGRMSKSPFQLVHSGKFMFHVGISRLPYNCVFTLQYSKCGA